MTRFGPVLVRMGHGQEVGQEVGHGAASILSDHPHRQWRAITQKPASFCCDSRSEHRTALPQGAADAPCLCSRRGGSRCRQRGAHLRQYRFLVSVAVPRPVPPCLVQVENLTMLVATEGLQEVQEEEGTSQVRSSPSRASDASNRGAVAALLSCTTSRRCPAFCCVERIIGLCIGEELPKEE